MNTEYLEKIIHTNISKPFALYRQRMPEFFACTPLHCHSEFEINFIREGCADYIIGSDKFTSQEGDIIITVPNVLHAAYPHGSCRQIYEVFLFSADMLGASSADRLNSELIYPIVRGVLYINPEINQNHVYYNELRTSMENIISSALGDSPQLDMVIKSELLRMIWLLQEAGDIKKINTEKNIVIEMIRPAVEYMNKHFSEKISISTLAKETCLSESYFMRKFREAAGISAIEYLNALRVKSVCIQLVNSKKTMAEIAFDCGFGNLSNFNRVFRHVMGVTPKEYKAAVLNSKTELSF